MGFKEYIVRKWYPHKYGIMGTVIFHLLLAIVLLGMGINRMKAAVEMEVVLAAPPEEVMKKIVEEKERKQELLKKTSEAEVQEMLRSIAVNENAKQKSVPSGNVQKYIDEVTEELDNEGYSGKYKARRDKNYRKDSLQHARDKKEQTLDSLKSTFYSGKSSVSYNLKDRYARFLPIPVFRCEFGGKVVVSITVNRKGKVQKAEVIASLSKQDDCLYDVAVDAALRSSFNESSGAPELQTGTITYNFVKQ